MRYLLSLCLLLTIGFVTKAQEPVFNTFKMTHVINTHSVETLPARKLEFSVVHRFGDFAGDQGGWETFYGLENASDILFGFDYGVSDNFMIGISRSKGAGPLKRLINGLAKWRMVQQTENGTPISVTLVGITSFSTMQKSANAEAINFFEKTSHRLAYNGQILIARKFSPGFSLQLVPGYTYRNIVPFNDENGIFSLGIATRLQVSKVVAVVADYTYPFSDLRTSENGYFAPLGIGIEWDTGGHVFQINFTNSSGIMETDYIPNTRSDWAEGEFRLGFTISRIFNI